MKKLIIILIAMFLTTCVNSNSVLKGNELVLSEISESANSSLSFLQLQIGESTSADLLLAMENSQYLQEDAVMNPLIGEKDNGVEYTYLVDSQYGDAFRFNFENDILERMTINFSHLELSQLINKFDEPDFIYTIEWITPKGPDLMTTLIYQDIGLLVTFGPKLNKKEYIVTEDVIISGIDIMKINDIQVWYDHHLGLVNPEIENSAKYLYNWKGYGEFSDLYPNVIPSE